LNVVPGGYMGGEGTSSVSSDLGLILAVLRTGRGWSQARLARESGIPASSISQYETGKKLPELGSLIRLLETMGFGFSDVDRARLFLLSLRVDRAPAEARRVCAAEIDGSPDPRLEQIASMTSEVGTAVSRLTEAMAFLIREHPCAHGRQDAEKEVCRGKARETPAPEDRAGANALWKRLQKYPPPLRDVLIRESRDFQSWALCELLCLESEKQAAHDALTAVHLATLALRIAELVGGEELWQRRLRGYATAFLGNALRVQGNLRGAEEAFDRSDELWRAGAASKVLLLEESRLLGLKATLRRDQRLFGESLELLDRALEMDRQGALTGYLLLKRAKTLEELGDLEAAIGVLGEARSLIDQEQDPKLFAWLQHNRMDYLSKLGRYTAAESLLPEVKLLLSRFDDDLSMARLHWVEGRIADGLGRTDQGIEILTQVRGEFASRSMHYDTALVSLELATIFAREGRADPVKALARHMTPIFQAQGVHREALAALALFRQAAESENVTADLARRLLEYLHRARHDPKLRFEAQ
jgi:transcriptional regulator with XRE-family HTH domain/tetratricopeptide (TPR) repeat protein